MLRRCPRGKGVSTVWRCAPVLLLLLGLLVLAPASRAQLATLGPVTIGAGLQTGYFHTETEDAPTTDQFELDHARIYINGSVTDTIKFMFNTDYDSVTNKIGVLDAVAEFDFAPEFHIWAGRFLEPSDRANLYGPFFANEWSVYNDGVQDGYPFVYQGRDNGIAYWGDFKKVKVSAGAFDGKSATGASDVLAAARVQIDFWDKEDGYYLNGTYYGDKNLLALGGATQYQNGHTASSIDFLLEKKVLNGGAFTIESEWTDYNRLGGYDANYAKSEGEYGLASFLFPKKFNFGKLSGKFQILGKYAKADFTHGTGVNFDQKTADAELNYVIKQFNARVMSFYEHINYNNVKPDAWQAGLGLQIQM